MTTLLFGPAGWLYDDWKGVVYPRPQPRGFHPLPYLARYVNLVEVNATFYAPLKADTAARWVEMLQDQSEFRFVVKVWQCLTHERNLPTDAEVATWSEVLRPLLDAGRLICVLAQFPWSVRDTPDARRRLLEIRDAMPDGVTVAAEFRHRSWAGDDVVPWLRDEGLAFVNIDQPQSRDGLPPTGILAAPPAYVRLHGRNAAAWFSRDAGRDARYDWRYSSDELDPWAERIEHLRDQTPVTVLVGNNHFMGKAMAAVLELAHKLTGKPVLVPETMLGTFPDLESIRRPDPGQLF